MWQSIKSFFQRPLVWVGFAVAAVGVVVLRFYQVNDFTRPSITPHDKPRDYSTELEKLDPTRPIGILLFNVKSHFGNVPVVGSAEPLVINAVRNNLKDAMRQHYGDNVIVVDDASMAELKAFSNQFNKRFDTGKPEVHFVANHHQGTYDDYELASFLQSIEAKNKRALLMACGPRSAAYNIPGFDCVIIPRADGQITGPELSLKLGPAYYTDAIGWMRDCDPAVIQEKFNKRGLFNDLRDRLMMFDHNIAKGKLDYSVNPPVVITPSGIPNKPGYNPTR